jgi:protein TonB
MFGFAWRAGRSSRSPATDATTSVLVEVSVEPSPAPADPAPTSPPQTPPKGAALDRRSPPRPRATSPRDEPSSASSGETSSETSSDPAPGPSVPVDLRGETIVSASTGPSVGGSGDARGNGRSSGRKVEGNSGGPSPLGPGSGDRSGGVALEDQNWSCPWPREADAERIDEQTVVIKLVVAPDGTVESATVLSDPGHGFGPAATSCALRTRFNPARDRDGRSIRAVSPPIVVRFTR